MIFIILFLLPFVYSKKSYCERPEFTLKPLSNYNPLLLQLIFRHGDRSPWVTYKADDASFHCDVSQQLRYISLQNIESLEFAHAKSSIDFEKNKYAKNNIYGGTCQMGQLTRKGLNQLAELGDIVRESYVGENNFLPVFYNESEIYVRSTNVWRVLQSAESFMQHLYPSKFRDPDLRIPIESLPSEIEYAVSNAARCPRMSQLDDELFTKWFKEELNKRNESPYKEIIEKCYKMFGDPDYNWYDSFFDILEERECNNFPLPCVNVTMKNEQNEEYVEELCISQEEYDTLVELIEYEGVYRFFDNDTIPMGRLHSGWLLRDVLNFQHQKVNKKTNLRYTHFHAHDTTIYPMVSLLEGDYSEWPPYASYIIFELYEKDGEQYVRVGYNNNYIDMNYCEKNEDGLCKWQEFYDYLIKKVPDIKDCEKQ